MDYKGQQICEILYYILTILFGGIAWIIGYYSHDFQITFHGWCIGMILALILCIPDWPLYNRNKVVWLDEASSVELATNANSSKKSKKSKKEQ